MDIIDAFTISKYKKLIIIRNKLSKTNYRLLTQHFDKIFALILATGGEFDVKLPFGVYIIPVKA